MSRKLKWRLTWRDGVSFALVLAVGLWGAWHELQVVVLLAGATGLAVLHGGLTNRVFHTALGFGNRLKSAKWRDVELAATERQSQRVPLIAVDGRLGFLVSDLDPHAFGLLQRVRREYSVEVTAAIHNRAVFLQDRGLLTAEERAISTRSPWAWWPPSATFWVSLSDLGSDVMTELGKESTGVPRAVPSAGQESQIAGE